MDLPDLPAVRQRALLARREVSARELLEAHRNSVEQRNPRLNAIVTETWELAEQRAAAADEASARGESLGVLHGLPVAHKDLFLTAGIRTTKGSPLLADWVPAVDSLIVARQRAAGAVTIGKTNTPEFGAGSQTFNEVFGVTRNPWDPDRTCGGSSGGAAVALATGMVALADGSDMGGSLRNPASFCGVVGLRPSPGRVPSWPTETPWSPLSVHGPMGRTVRDVALFLSAIAGPDPRAPLSLEDGPAVFERLDPRHHARVAWTPDLGLPVDPAVRQALASVPGILEQVGCEVTGDVPDLASAGEVFQVLRSFSFETSYGPLYDEDPTALKATLRWNVEEARRRGATELASAERERARLMEIVDGFFGEHDALALPTVQVPPFPVEVEWVDEIDGVSMPTYIDWMRSCSDISVLGLPAVSVPAAFTEDGLPVGLQLVGRPRGDLDLLRIAAAFEDAAGVGSLATTAR